MGRVESAGHGQEAWIWPSFIAMRRSAAWATSGLWVTITRVRRRRCRSWSSKRRTSSWLLRSAWCRSTLTARGNPVSLSWIPASLGSGVPNGDLDLASLAVDIDAASLLYHEVDPGL